MQGLDTAQMRVQHACAVPVSDEHRWEISARYVAEGLATGDRVVYFEDDTARQVLARLADDGVVTDRAIASGQFVISPQEATRTVFSGPVEVLEQAMLATVDDSLAHGYPGVRVAGELRAIWHLGAVGPPDYDLGVRRVLAQRPTVRALCLYDEQRYPAELLAELRAMHARELTGPAVYDDGLLRITRTALGGARLAGETDHSNRGVLDRLLATVLDATLRSPTGPSAVTVDVSSLRFLDVAGAMAFVRAAERFPSTHRLLLRGTRSRVHRVLERCGALFVPQLDVLVRGEAAPSPDAPPTVRGGSTADPPTVSARRS
jgi:anti-anti-sigma regulatory factor